MQTKPQTAPTNVYTAAASARAKPEPVTFSPNKPDDDDLGYGVLAKNKKKGKSHNKGSKYEYVSIGTTSAVGGFSVVRKAKKGQKQAGQGADENAPRERAICGCQARLHPFVNNCLRCGRIVCLQEDVGPCFFCSHYVTPQGVPQVAPFTATTTPTPTEEEAEEVALKHREAEGLKRAQENLSRLLHFDQTMAERTTVYDDQSDYFDMANRWISADERKKLAEKETALLKSKAEATAVVVLDFAGRSVVASAQTSEEVHQRFKDQLVAELKDEQAQQKMMDREEAEEHQLQEMERIKGHIKHRPDGSIFVLPTLDIPPPDFIARQKEAVQGGKKGSQAAPFAHPSSQPSPLASLQSSSSTVSAPKSMSSSAATKASSRLQTEFYPEVEMEHFDLDISEADSNVLTSQEGSVKLRGVVEGFSNKTWTSDDRLDMINWMASIGGNFYVWAPNDDPMCRRLWNHLFSDEEVANMRATVAKSKALGVEFNLALRPQNIDFRSLLHVDALARKYLQAYEQCGVRSFSFVFADMDRAVPQGCRSLASAQAELVNTIIQVVDEFVRLKNTSSEASSSNSAAAASVRWLFCPTVYSSELETGKDVAILNYLRTLNKEVDSRVQFMWSGPTAPAASINKEYLLKTQKFFGKRPLFFWDRLPQFSPPNDYPTHSADAFDYSLHTNQYVEVYNQRATALGQFFDGALVSTMAAPLPSRVLLSTALSFYKDAKSYSPKDALLPTLKRHVLPAADNDNIAKALAALLSIIPSSPMTYGTRPAIPVNKGDTEERKFFTDLKTHLATFEKSQDASLKAQLAPTMTLLKNLVGMNVAYWDYTKNPNKEAPTVTATIRALRDLLIPVLYTEYDLTTYRTQLFAHAVPDKSLKGDVQRTYLKFKAQYLAGHRDTLAKEACVRLATEATISMRELEDYLISEYRKDDVVAWRNFLNVLYFRNPAETFLHKIPLVTSPPAPQPNLKILELRSARIKQKLADEEKMKTVALKFELPFQPPEETPEVDPQPVAAPSAAESTPKKVRAIEVRDLPVPGMRYIRDFLMPQQEADLIAAIDAQSWDTELSRRIQQYGFKFLYRVDKEEYDSHRLELTQAFAPFLRDLAESLLNAKYTFNKPDQAIINEYTPGQGIRHHIDNPAAFEDCIISVSLGSAAVMEFANEKTNEKVSWLLEPRSVLILTKDSRSQWSHGIAARTEDIWNGITIKRERRISVTLRKVKANVARSLFGKK